MTRSHTSPFALLCAALLLTAACGSAASPASPDAGLVADSGIPLDGGALDAMTDGGVDASAPTVRFDTLFIGNSYTYVNDLPGHYRSLVSALSPDVRVESVTAGGYRLTQHAADARMDGTPLARWLRTGTAAETAFDAVVLQEQSQIGGFPEGSPDRAASVAGASELAALATARGATVVLYLTWGYQHGDPTNAGIGYGTYTGMQDQLDTGYLALAARLRTEGSEVLVAPVGGGFRTVFEDVTLTGAEPLAAGSDFVALYEADGSHPSLRGAYLASCIMAGTITAADARGFVDEPTLGPALSSALREVCARALADPRW